jgi:polysaccharide export outer membrane protein
VNIVVRSFVGTFGEQIRVVGKAIQPKALAYRRNLTVLDVMIEVGGLAEGAAGNRAKEMMPGDVLIIPESRL